MLFFCAFLMAYCGHNMSVQQVFLPLKYKYTEERKVYES